MLVKFEALHGVKDRTKLQIIVTMRVQPCSNSRLIECWLWKEPFCSRDVASSFLCTSPPLTFWETVNKVVVTWLGMLQCIQWFLSLPFASVIPGSIPGLELCNVGFSDHRFKLNFVIIFSTKKVGGYFLLDALPIYQSVSDCNNGRLWNAGWQQTYQVHIQNLRL